ncbi:hypothetical protein SD37_29350 [Amycolatopsis orientalis]|uniref:Uncharacterized protein n=1 Tax=Amycolatopsis orientalis TaxID=31958 RepID=A0A193C433_AMYOR|nr:hypothetical protein [Amycolatopsis orientalis]ANN19316.1 hypothetical protein SD37_29350 [Amycolatopsis orientalis]
MQPNPPQHGLPQYGLPQYGLRPKPRANTAAAVTAGILGVLTACMLVWFVLYNVIYASAPEGGWSGQVMQNVVFGVIAAVVLMVAAAFTFARRIPGAWTLFGFCVFYVMAVLVATPLLWGTPLSTHLKWIFGFQKSNGVAIALVIIFGILTAITAAIAGSVKSRG